MRIRVQDILELDAAACWCMPNPIRPGAPIYEHLIPEFERSPTDPLHLLLPRDIRCTLERCRGDQDLALRTCENGEAVRMQRTGSSVIEGLEAMKDPVGDVVIAPLTVCD
ncbi:MAG: hypothetical protein VKI42_10300 [Synechococcaceae cyanobacterium]|nr:hypothetical protein [Synechococcaceae cyanobacterium]